MKDGVVKLANSYLSIQREGCIQFDDFYCFIDICGRRPVQVAFPSVDKVLYRHREEGKGGMDDITDTLEMLHKHLDSCVKLWRQDLDAYRR